MPDYDDLVDYFGEGPEGAVTFLLSRGYCLQNDNHWLKPTAFHVPPAKEWFALDYLADYHGYGKHLSVDIKKPIKYMCESNKSELLRAYLKLNAPPGKDDYDVSWVGKRRTGRIAIGRQTKKKSDALRKGSNTRKEITKKRVRKLALRVGKGSKNAY